MYKQLIAISMILNLNVRSFTHDHTSNFEALKQAHLQSLNNNSKVHNASYFSPKLCKIVLESAPLKVKRAIEDLKDKKLSEREKPNKILLYGPSGSGKTTLAQVIAQEVGKPCIFISAGLLGTEYKNSVPQNLLRIIDPHLMEPCVIVIDEAECILRQSRNEGDSDADTPRQVWEILDLIAKLPHITLILTTNAIPKMLKPLQTRFAGNTIEIPSVKSDKERKKIIYHFLEDKEHNCNDSYLNGLAQKVSDFSIREIETLIQSAKNMVRFRKTSPYVITPADFEAAFKEIKESREALANSAPKAQGNNVRESVGTALQVMGIAFHILQMLK